jgi:pimeloyl-ACP methyl ester carboxylesterase
MPALLLLFAAAGACTTATPACTEKVPLPAAGRWSLVYRSHPLTAHNDSIRRAFIMVHGQGRNADDYFRTALAAAFLAGGLNDTLVVSPRFAVNDGRSLKDQLGEGEVSWANWRGADPSNSDPKLSSFDLADEILKLLARKETFPNLQSIVVAGHSAGGQFVHRYAAASRVAGSLAVPVRFVASNPSSYLYLGPERLAPSATCSEKGGCTGEFVPYAEGRNCTTYDRYLYGLAGRRGYTESLSEDQLKTQLAKRDVTYLLSELDTLPLAGFDSSCPAMAQGPNRLARGVTYWNYIRTRFQADHKLVIVPLCGHNARCVFTSDPALNVVFPKP